MIRDAIKSALSEPTGQLSSSRILTAYVIIHVCGWISAAMCWVGYVAFRTKTIPDVSSLKILLDSLASFTLSVVGVTYGVNRATSAFGKTENISGAISAQQGNKNV